jgi:hypothetical protein
LTAREKRWQDLTLRLFRRIRSDLREAVDGATVAELNLRNFPGANSAGWLVWRIARVRSESVRDHRQPAALARR